MVYAIYLDVLNSYACNPCSKCCLCWQSLALITISFSPYSSMQMLQILSSCWISSFKGSVVLVGRRDKEDILIISPLDSPSEWERSLIEGGAVLFGFIVQVMVEG